MRARTHTPTHTHTHTHTHIQTPSTVTPKACRIGSSIAPTLKPSLSPVVSWSSEFPTIRSCHLHLGRVSLQQTFLTSVGFTGKVPSAQPHSFRQSRAPEETSPSLLSQRTHLTCVPLTRHSMSFLEDVKKVEMKTLIGKKVKHQYPL